MTLVSGRSIPSTGSPAMEGELRAIRQPILAVQRKSSDGEATPGNFGPLVMFVAVVAAVDKNGYWL